VCAVAVSTAVQVAYVEFAIDANLKGEPGTRPGSQDIAARPDAVARLDARSCNCPARLVMVHGESQVCREFSMRCAAAMQKSRIRLRVRAEACR
jgi:hypothetical protein